ncbi:MAG: response regulator transcription factor [Micrococcales bacterium]|nr:response regulator transcription factor [Micrococcales bacterium]MCL2668700.1 response regulator transcription factor [Micrococcales bacterium]
MGTLLVIDDDPHIRELVSELLVGAGFAVGSAPDGRVALRMLGESQVDLCVVDVMMPHVDGIGFAQAVRRYYPELPLLMLTAKGQLGDKVRGFEAGADDYLVKPFDGPELVARVKALLRRYRKVVEQTAHAGNVTLDNTSHVVTVGDDDRRELPLKEFELLFLLASHKGRTLTRRQILDEVWGVGFEGNERTLDVHINRLRDRFGEADAFAIVTVRGLGYRLEDRP